MIHHQVRTGRWRRVLPAVYAGFTGELTVEQRRAASFLYAGTDSQITGVSALRWHGLRYVPNDRQIHMLVPHTTQRTSNDFVRLQRTRRLDERAEPVNGYVVCSVARAVADACRALDDIDSVRAIVAESVQRSLTSVTAIERELNLAGCHRTRLLRLAVGEVAEGAASAPEGRLQSAFARSKILPRVVWNPGLVARDGTVLPSPDGWIDDVAIAIEVDSREYHLSPDGWKRTLRRHNILTAAGALVLHFTPSEIRNPRRVVHIVERAYLERTRLGAQSAIRMTAA